MPHMHFRSAATDTPIHNLQEAIRKEKYHYLADPQGRPAGLMGTRPLQAVTFVDNHDTGSTQAHWPFPRLAKLEGYAYILTHPGLPTVFWEHLYEVRLRHLLS